MSDRILPPESGTPEADLDPPPSRGLGSHPQIGFPDLVVHRPRHLTLVPLSPGGVDKADVAVEAGVPVADLDPDSAIVRLCALFGAATPEEALPRAEELLRRVKARGDATKGAANSSEWGTWDAW